MVRINVITFIFAVFSIVPVAHAQDDVYYNPNSTKSNSGNNNTDYQQQYESTPKQSPAASNPSDYDDKNDGYSTQGQSSASQYDTKEKTSNNEYYSDSYYDDDDYLSSWNYSSRLRRYYTPNYGVGFFSNWYDPFYWYQPVVVVNYGYRNPWYSSWRYDMCYYQPWRCNMQYYSYSYYPYSNWGWNSPCFGGNYGYSYGYGYPYNNYYGAYYGGYSNYGYGYNGYGYNGYNGYYGHDSYNQPHYSYSGPRHRSGEAGSNTSDGQIHRATGRSGKTDETGISNEGIVKPTSGRGTVIEQSKNPSGIQKPNQNPSQPEVVRPRIENANVRPADIGNTNRPDAVRPRIEESVPTPQPRQPQTRPMDYNQKPRNQQPLLNEDENLRPHQEMQPRQTAPVRIDNDGYQRPRQEMQERPRESAPVRINNDGYQRPRQEMQEQPRETAPVRINNDGYQRPRQEMQERPREIQAPRQEMHMNDGGNRNMGGQRYSAPSQGNFNGGNGGRSRGR